MLVIVVVVYVYVDNRVVITITIFSLLGRQGLEYLKGSELSQC